MLVPMVEVRDSVFDPDSTDRTAQVRNRTSAKPLYRVFLYLEGLSLPYITAATYVLHPSFKNPSRLVYRTPSNPRCKLEIWTWGLFRVQVVVSDSEGKMYTISHDLQYDKEFLGVKFISA
jgi:hypothetical protein